MPRHSKNNSDGAHFTYSERATMATTVGSTRSRLGGDSLRPYHHCCLSLAPARDPVLTPGGYLYDKPAILGALLAQRRAARAARAAAADAAAADAAAAEERGAASRDAAVAAFVDAGTPVVAATAAASAGVAAGASGAGAGAGGSGGAVGAVVGTRKEGLGPPPSNFWMPARAPIAAAAPAAAADPRTRCPVSGAALRAKQLIAVRFTRPPEAVAADAAAAAAATAATAAPAVAAAAAEPLSADGGAPAASTAGAPAAAASASTPAPAPPPSPTAAPASAIAATPSTPRPPPDGRVAVYVCAVCGDTLSNASTPTVLVPSGSVVCGECVRRFVVKTKTDPTTGERLRVPAGVVPIRAGGTAFAASGGEAKVASRYAPAARV